jgi:phosphoglucomutase/phosphomannomutase
VANPENPAVFGDLIERGREIGADLAAASDPDADRLGCAAPLAPGGQWQVLKGNQIAVLLADFILAQRHAAGTLNGDHYIVTTLVTTRMLRCIADDYQVQTFDNVLTGFKWIGGVIDERGSAGFLFAAEEAHGYLVGDYVRDKDAAGATMVLAELAARAKHVGRTLHQELDRIYARVGYHAESATSRTFAGAAGMSAMRATMHRLRSAPPETLGGMQVMRVRDYLHDIDIRPRTHDQPVGDSECDLLFFDLARPGYSAAVRPSGTEPKLKFYFFAREATDGKTPTEAMRRAVAEKLAAIERDLLQAAGCSR